MNNKIYNMHHAFRKNWYSEFSFHADFKYVFELLKMVSETPKRTRK